MDLHGLLINFLIKLFVYSAETNKSDRQLAVQTNHNKGRGEGVDGVTLEGLAARHCPAWFILGLSWTEGVTANLEI